MSATPDLWSLVLAAGGSQRLGRPKQALSIGAQSLLLNAVQRANVVTPQKVICVLGAYQPPAPMPCQTRINSNWRLGMASSIATGLNAVPHHASVLITLCDQPDVSADHLAQLVDCHYQDVSFTVAAFYAGFAGVPAVFPAALRPTLLKLRGDEGARKVLRNAELKLKTVDIPQAATDIDTPTDWTQWRSNVNASD